MHDHCCACSAICADIIFEKLYLNYGKQFFVINLCENIVEPFLFDDRSSTNRHNVAATWFILRYTVDLYISQSTILIWIPNLDVRHSHIRLFFYYYFLRRKCYFKYSFNCRLFAWLWLHVPIQNEQRNWSFVRIRKTKNTTTQCFTKIKLMKFYVSLYPEYNFTPVCFLSVDQWVTQDYKTLSPKKRLWFSYECA